MIRIFILFLCCPFFSYCSSETAPAPAKQDEIKAVVFDFSGVIAKTNFSKLASEIAQQLHMSQQEAEQLLQKRKQDLKQGVSEEKFWDDEAKRRGCTLPLDWGAYFDEASFRALEELPGMIALVKSLKAQHYQVALLSNVRAAHARVKERLGLYTLFDPLLLSYQTGLKKPDPRAYQLLLSKLQLPPSKVLFIDNKEANIEAARRMGIHAIQFRSPKQVMEELKEYGIDPQLPPELEEQRRPHASL